MSADGEPCATLLEAAYQNGYKTGLVATSRITHATPGSFAAHVVDRDLEAAIAVQETGQYALGQNVDLMFGGGRCYFEPNSTSGSCRQDKVDLLKYVRSQNWDVRLDATSFRSMTAADASKTNLGLFAQGVHFFLCDSARPSCTQGCLAHVL